MGQQTFGRPSIPASPNLEFPNHTHLQEAVQARALFEEMLLTKAARIQSFEGDIQGDNRSLLCFERSSSVLRSTHVEY